MYNIVYIKYIPAHGQTAGRYILISVGCCNWIPIEMRCASRGVLRHRRTVACPVIIFDCCKPGTIRGGDLVYNPP